MCKLMNIQPYGTDAYLRYSLRTKLGWYLTACIYILSVEIVLSASDLEVVFSVSYMVGLLMTDTSWHQ